MLLSAAMRCGCNRCIYSVKDYNDFLEDKFLAIVVNFRLFLFSFFFPTLQFGFIHSSARIMVQKAMDSSWKCMASLDIPSYVNCYLGWSNSSGMNPRPSFTVSFSMVVNLSLLWEEKSCFTFPWCFLLCLSSGYCHQSILDPVYEAFSL